jgi:hypothetical protein
MLVFETDDGRTFAGADASISLIVVLIAFFETAVHQLACSLHGWGRQRASRASARTNPAKAKNVTVAEV